MPRHLHHPLSLRPSRAGAAALFAAWALASCGGGGGGSPTVAPQSNDAAIAASAPGELADYVKGKLRERVALRRTSPGTIYFEDNIGGPEWLGTVTTTGGTAERSGTAAQEQGIDEEDLIKSDGRIIATLAPSRGDGTPGSYAHLLVYDALGTNAKPTPASRLELKTGDTSYAATHGMYLAADARRAAVVAESTSFLDFPDCPEGMACTSLLPYPRFLETKVHLQVVDIADASRASLGTKLVIDGRLVGSRLVGNTLYLVTSHAPQFAVERLPTTATAAERDAALASLHAADFLPKVVADGGAAQPLVVDTQCYTQAKNASLDLTVTTITAIDLAAAGAPRTSRCFVGGSEALYMSPTSLYLATSRYEVQTLATTALRFAPDTRTDIHKFAIAGSGIAYRGSGQVAGHLGWDSEKAPYRMSEHNGDLRVLSFTGQLGWASAADAASRASAASPATLTVLRERTSDRSLQVVSTLPNAQRPAPIGLEGEQVYAVRFVGDRGYVVTFRQTDPLYVLDLSNPADPRAAGELKMPGFSDYLYPLPNGRLLGVGRDAGDDGRVRGLKVALFDVANAANPRVLAQQVLGERGSYSGLDTSRHALNMLVRDDSARVALPVGLYSAGSATMRTGLQRFDVDTAAGTLTMKPLIASGGGQGDASRWFDLSTDRSLQIGSKLYYLTQGTLTLHDW